MQIIKCWKVKVIWRLRGGKIMVATVGKEEDMSTRIKCLKRMWQTWTNHWHQWWILDLSEATLMCLTFSKWLMATKFTCLSFKKVLNAILTSSFSMTKSSKRGSSSQKQTSQMPSTLTFPTYAIYRINLKNFWKWTEIFWKDKSLVEIKMMHLF